MTAPHTTSSPVDILVLGGGFAGLNTAFQLSNYPWTRPVRITLVDRNDRFLFTPMAYEILTGEVEVWEIAPLYRDILGNRPVRFVQGVIERIDLEKRQVQVGDTTHRYDYLVLALGDAPTSGRCRALTNTRSRSMTWHTSRPIRSTWPTRSTAPGRPLIPRCARRC